jgi:hypothetical protein
MEQHNRIEAAIKSWQEREQRFEQLIPGTIKNNKHFMKEKLVFLEHLQVRYAGSMSIDERLMSRVIQKEKQALKQAIYPNRVLRLLRDLITPFRQQQQIKTQERSEANNVAELSAKLIRSGFGEANSQMVQQMKQGKESFSIPVSYYPSEKERVDFNLNFKRNESGAYEFTNYKATLTDGSSKELRTHSFAVNQGLGLNQHEIANLLAGRPILKQEPDVPWKSERWVQLDLNDKDADGNHRIRVVKPGESFDLQSMLKKAGISEIQIGMEFEKAVQLLKQGDLLNLSIGKNGAKQSFFMEANPIQRSINIYDDQHRKTSIDQVLKPKVTSTKMIELNPQKVREGKETKKNKGLSH